MQKLLMKLSPILLLLLVFSCAKDNEIAPLEAEKITVQARGGSHECNIPCQKPDLLHVNDIEGCSAVVSWSYFLSPPSCGTFSIQLQNLATGNYVYYNSVTNPFLLENLESCTQYTVGISHTTDQCSSKPLEVSFQTACKKCKGCDIPCQDPDFLSVDDLTLDGATITFGFNQPTCGYFIAQLKNNATGAYTYINPAVSPLVLTGLDECTSYTIGLSHTTDECSRLPTKISFTTECGEYCESSGDDPSCLYVFGILLEDNDWLFTDDPSTGYIDATNEELFIAPETEVFAASNICYCGNLPAEEVHLKLWIDYNQNFEFDSNELIFTHTVPISGTGSPAITCPASWFLPQFTFPNMEACGLRARYIVSDDPDAGPCGSFTTGQVVDFTINSMAGC